MPRLLPATTRCRVRTARSWRRWSTSRSAAEARLLGDLASGALTPVAVEPADWERIAQLTVQYRDLPLGTVDESVVATAERLGLSFLATLDRRIGSVLHSDGAILEPRHVRNGGQIIGGARFAHWTQLTPRLAWDAFGQLNGAPTFESFLRLIARYRSSPIDPLASPIGASVLVEPFFLSEDQWIPSPADWSANLTRGKAYDSEIGEGLLLWARLVDARPSTARPPAVTDLIAGGFAAEVLTRPRIGQGAFRVMVTDAYERRCAITGERTLPVLEAAHIQPYSMVGEHRLSNGILLRSDLHRLFDLGYVSVDPRSRELLVSSSIREEFSNGREYYQLQGRQMRLPGAGYPSPSTESLEWHASQVFRG